LHDALPPADELPWTISFVVRKRIQIDSYNELPKEKRPPDKLIWYGTSEDIEKWFDKVFSDNKKKDTTDPEEFVFIIDENEIG